MKLHPIYNLKEAVVLNKIQMDDEPYDELDDELEESGKVNTDGSAIC